MFQKLQLFFVRFFLRVLGNKMLNDLNKKSRDCYHSQHSVLMDIIHYCRNTEYGKKHNFKKIKTINDFQTKVPINNYDHLESHLYKHTEGHKNVIIPGKPLLFATTSGTTARPKWIPITKKYYKECYNGLSKLMLHSIIQETPEILDGMTLSIVGKAVEGSTNDGTPYGAFSGHAYRDIPAFLRRFHAVPYPVYSIDDYDAKYYCFLRFSLEKDIRMIFSVNPSSLLQINQNIQSFIDELILDIETGSLKPNLAIPSETRRILEKKLTPNPDRANELRDLKMKYTNLTFKHLWPRLKVILTWRCGNSGLYLQHTSDFFPRGCRIRELGYLATEARAGIILKANQVSSIMAGHLLFFEFIKKDAINKPNPRIYLAHELDVGEYYYIFITTSSGLFRYNMNDILKVEGYYNQFPMMKFVQKGAGVTTLTGEKVYEEQLLESIRRVEKRLNMKTQFHIGFADYQISGYRLFAEFSRMIPNNKMTLFCKEIDNELQKINMEYESKRKSNRIKPMRLHYLSHNAFDKFKRICIEMGYRDGQFKLSHLMQDEKRMKIFQQLSLGEIHYEN